MAVTAIKQHNPIIIHNDASPGRRTSPVVDLETAGGEGWGRPYMFVLENRSAYRHLVPLMPGFVEEANPMGVEVEMIVLRPGPRRKWESIRLGPSPFAPILRMDAWEKVELGLRWRGTLPGLRLTPALYMAQPCGTW